MILAISTLSAGAHKVWTMQIVHVTRTPRAHAVKYNVPARSLPNYVSACCLVTRPRAVRHARLTAQGKGGVKRLGWRGHALDYAVSP
jgi:hypothetical protein